MGRTRVMSTSRWLRIAALAAVTGAAVLSGALAGGAAQTFTMVVVPSQVPPGGFFAVSNADGSECAPGATVTGSVLGLPVSGWTTTADGNGDWTKQLFIYENIGYDVFGNPIPTPPGEYLVEASCSDGGGTDAGAAAPIVYEEAVVTVLAPVVPVDPPAVEAVETEPTFTG